MRVVLAEGAGVVQSEAGVSPALAPVYGAARACARLRHGSGARGKGVIPMTTRTMMIAALIGASGSLVAVVSEASAAPFVETFDGLSAAQPLPVGWTQKNNSDPVGVSGQSAWFRSSGFSVPVAPQSGANAIATNFQAGAGVSTLSAWLMTPVMNWSDGEVITFWTRSLNSPTDPTNQFADRLQVRLSVNGGRNPGSGASDVGDFVTLLLDINPTLAASGSDAYPTSYRQYNVTLSGLPGGSADGSLAFRYFVPSGGPSGDNSNAVIVDTLSVVPTPGAAALLGLGGVAAARRRRV